MMNRKQKIEIDIASDMYQEFARPYKSLSAFMNVSGLIKRSDRVFKQ